MHGITPINHSLTLLQRQTSAKISDAMPAFPTAVSDLISEMAVPDFSLALQALELDRAGEAVQNEKNQKIISMIELALTSPSSECDPLIKAAVFKNASENLPPFPQRMNPYLATIINGLKRKGQQIILDDVVLRDLNLSWIQPIDFGGMSAKRAVFENVSMNYLQLERADFTGAHFFRTSLECALLNKANIVNARFSQVSFRNTQVCELTANQSTIFKLCSGREQMTILDEARMVRLASSYLKGINIFAIPDSEKFTLPAQKIVERFDLS